MAMRVVDRRRMPQPAEPRDACPHCKGSGWTISRVLSCEFCLGRGIVSLHIADAYREMRAIERAAAEERA